MHESATSFHNLETPAPGTTLPPGRHLLRGWVLPKAGGHFVDVRARAQGRLFAGVHGLPRADLAVYFQTGRPYALAEFTVAAELTPGPAEIILEALDIEGRWREFTRGAWRVDPALPPVDFAVPSGPLRWHEFGRIVQILLRAQRRQPAVPLTTLARQVVATIPYPRDLRHPHAPFTGHLDEPAAVARTALGRSPVLGYLFHQTQPIRRVLATFDLQAWQTIPHGQPSPGVGAHYPQFPFAKNCTLHGVIDVPAQLPDPVCVRVYAELTDGSLHLCSVQRSRSLPGEEEKAPYPPQDVANFAQTLTALQAAMAEQGVAVVEDDEFRREIARLAEDFRLRAPLPQTVPKDTGLGTIAPAQAGGRSLGREHATTGHTGPAVSPGDGRDEPRAPSRAQQGAGNGVPPKRVLLVTHNLNLEGAPLFLVDYAQQLASAGSSLTVISESTGPLRGRFEELGATVRIVDAAAVAHAPSAAAARAEISRLGREIDFASFDLVVGNTFTTFWAVHAAKQAGRPVLLYVHESNTPGNFYHDRAHPEVVSLVEEAFGLADAVSFTTASTRGYHLDYGRPANHRLTPGWIDVARIDRWLAQNPRAALRARFNLRPGELLVTNIGTVCERKGQHIFARAVDLLWRRHPELAARARFVMLGGGATAFDDSLADLLAHLGRPNLTVHPSTPDYFPYYAAADLFVCSTYEESSPRVILEAMACGTPILSSDVHGIPEQVRSGREALLVPAGDTSALCEGLATLLGQPDLAATLAAHARARVTAEFDSARVLPRHLALACELAAHPG